MSISRQGIQRPDIIPGARVIRTTDLVLSSGVTSVVSYQDKRYDVGGMWNGAAKLLVTRKGRYALSFGAVFDTGSTGDRRWAIRCNATTIAAVQTAATSCIWNCISTIYEADLGDYFDTTLFQTQTALLNALATGNYSIEFAANWIGEP